jgi:hypothetical protein
MKNDELMAQREQDAEGMDEMEAKVLEYKKKYDSIRIELRNLKGEHCSRGSECHWWLTHSDINHVYLETSFG